MEGKMTVDSLDSINHTDSQYSTHSSGRNYSNVTVGIFTMEESTTDVLHKTTENSTVQDIYTANQSSVPFQGHVTSAAAMVSLSVLFSIIVLIGICGNIIVIYSILSDRNMRSSVTNCFILNLAVADLIILLLGVPEMVQFILNRGWLLGKVLCKVNRYILVTSLYASISTLMGVCIER